MRLDLFLVENKYAETRSKASQLIKNGKVLVNSRPASKNGFEIKDTDQIKILENDVLEYEKLYDKMAEERSMKPRHRY